MRILLLAPSFFELGGIGQYLRQFVTACETLGHNVEIVSLSKPEFPDPQVIVAYCGGDKPTFLRTAWRSRSQCDLVVAGHVSLAPVAWGMRKPYVVVAYGIDVWDRLPFMRHHALSRAKRVVCISGYTAAMVGQSNGIFPPQGTVIHPAVEDWLLEAGKSAVGASQHDPFTILTVSRLDSRERYKGHDRVIEAILTAAQRLGNRTLRYIIAGGGDDEPRLRDLAQHAMLKCPSSAIRFDFRGPIQRWDLSRLYSECDLFIMPSTHEGFGIVYLEAQAHGKPVIAGGGGPEEAILDGVSGHSTKNQLNYPLVDRIVELAQDDVKRINMGRAGRDWVEKHFTMERFTRQVGELIASLEGEHGPRRPRD